MGTYMVQRFYLMTYMDQGRYATVITDAYRYESSISGSLPSHGRISEFSQLVEKLVIV
jgi:hypothetical protein